MSLRALLTPRPRLDHGDQLEIDGLPLRLRVHAGARRISLRLDSRERIVIATAPDRARLPDAVAFARQRQVWIAAQLARLPEPVSFTPGRIIQVEARPCRLERAAMRIRPTFKPATTDEPARLLASGDGEVFARGVTRGLKALAEERLVARTALHAAALGQPLPQISITDAKARWGSCKQAHRGQPAQIRYNWRLILAPPAVLDYVAAHECAHLLEANHGPQFWEINARLHPALKTSRAWLKANGQQLHAAGQG
jgi:predicted metal-dependent hydrolase